MAEPRKAKKLTGTKQSPKFPAIPMKKPKGIVPKLDAFIENRPQGQTALDALRLFQSEFCKHTSSRRVSSGSAVCENCGKVMKVGKKTTPVDD